MSFTVLAEIDVEASPQLVWEVLVDVEAWSEWSTWLRYEGGQVAAKGVFDGEHHSPRRRRPRLPRGWAEVAPAWRRSSRRRGAKGGAVE